MSKSWWPWLKHSFFAIIYSFIAFCHKNYNCHDVNKLVCLIYWFVTCVISFMWSDCSIYCLNSKWIITLSWQEKYVSFNFYYSEIESITLEELRNEYYITLQLSCHVTASQQKCFLFECLDLEDFAQVIEFHSPRHATWLEGGNKSWRHRKVRI